MKVTGYRKGLQIVQAVQEKGASLFYDAERGVLVLQGASKVPEPLLAEIRAHRGEVLQALIPPGQGGITPAEFLIRSAKWEMARQHSAAPRVLVTENSHSTKGEMEPETPGGPSPQQADLFDLEPTHR